MKSVGNSSALFLRAAALFLMCTVLLLAAVNDSHAVIVRDTLAVVFVQDPERDYPDLEFECLDAVSLDAFIGDSGHRFHLWGNLILRYESTDIQTGQPGNPTIAPLHFSFVPFDGPGKEYDLERGIKFNVDATFYDWGFKFGNDIEGHFIPPMLGETEPLSDMLAEIFSKGKWCFGGVSYGIYTVEEFLGKGVTIPLYIQKPSGDDELFVYFEETSKDSIILDLPDVIEITKNIVIKEYSGEIIIEAGPSEMPEFMVVQTEGLQPGFEISIVDPDWSWFPNPCRQETWYEQFYPWLIAFSNWAYIPIDTMEGAPVRWTLNTSTTSSVAEFQDLKLKCYRLSDEPPELEIPDTLVTVIRNLYGDIGLEYRQIKLDYYIQGATYPEDDIFIGSRILSSGSPDLEAFNSGKSDHIKVDFVYDESKQNYIFKKDHRWNPKGSAPRYVVKMTSDVLDSPESGNNWICLKDEPSSGSNNVAKYSFELPLPDFGFDSLVVHAPPYLQIKSLPDEPDSVFFTFRVKNSGSDYDGASSVPVKCSMLFQNMLEDGQWNTVVNSTIYSEFLPSINTGTFWRDSFFVEIPDDYISQQLDRAYFIFEVNIDPGNPDTTVIQEQAYGFINNKMYTYMNLANYPDSAYAAAELYMDTETIEPYLPPINATPPCEDTLYLYVADGTFIEDGYMPPALVHIGVGEYGTSPRDSNWQWFPCDYYKDMIDGNGCLWKVYGGSPCFFEFIEEKDYSYCFRASLNIITSFSPAYIYVDSDGASCAADSCVDVTCCNEPDNTCCDKSDNSYFYDKAGYAKVAPLGAMLWRRAHGQLFQDNFPDDEYDIEGFIRADMAEDINYSGNLAIIPGDSIVVGCMVLDPGGMRLDGDDRPEIYMHVKCTYISDYEPSKTSPLAGMQLQGDYGTYEGDDGTWTIIQGDSAVDSSGDPARDLFMFDLNDALFTRGYMIEYYFTAYDTNDERGIFPYRAEDGDYLEFTCLPTLASNILYVDDYDGIVTPDGLVQNYFDQAFRAVLLPDNQPDRYDVIDPSSLLSNGLGSRAKLLHLIEAYTTIIWDSGDLTRGTICDSTYQSDKSRDCQVLLEWMDMADHDVNLFILGNDISRDLSERFYPDNSMFMNIFCNVKFIEDSYYEVSGGCGSTGMEGEANITITGYPGSPFDSDSYCLAGCYDFWTPEADPYWGHADTICPPVKAFDILNCYDSPLLYALEYPEVVGFPYFPYAGIYNTFTNSSGQNVKTMWFGFSYKEIRDCEFTPAPILRNLLLADVFTYFGITINVDITGDVTPSMNKLAQNFPNPFNPSTVIRFTIREKGQVNLMIYNVAGQLVKTLVNEVKETGHYAVTWDGRNNNALRVASGVYFCRLETGSFNQTKKIVLLR